MSSQNENGIEGPSNVDVPVDPASRTAKIEAERNPSNAAVEQADGPTLAAAKAGVPMRHDDGEKPKPKAHDDKLEGEKPRGGKTLGREMDETKSKRK